MHALLCYQQALLCDLISPFQNYRSSSQPASSAVQKDFVMVANSRPIILPIWRLNLSVITEETQADPNFLQIDQNWWVAVEASIEVASQIFAGVTSEIEGDWWGDIIRICLHNWCTMDSTNQTHVRSSPLPLSWRRSPMQPPCSHTNYSWQCMRHAATRTAGVVSDGVEAGQASFWQNRNKRGKSHLVSCTSTLRRESALQCLYQSRPR